MSILQDYKASSLLFNDNFLDQTSESGLWGYRGELVLVQGEVADDKGHLKPPVEVMRGVAILADDKIKMIIGAIDRLTLLQTFVDKYQDGFSDDILAVLFVVDIEAAMRVEFGGVSFVLIPMVQGVPWNEMIDELALEKSDFKGQSAADKIVTMYDEIKTYEPKYPDSSFDDAMASTTGQVRESWGAV
ncbi:MAG: hypothetical protein AB2813_08125 [Candidatus Sedimenticola endophacoides]